MPLEAIGRAALSRGCRHGLVDRHHSKLTAGTQRRWPAAIACDSVKRLVRGPSSLGDPDDICAITQRARRAGVRALARHGARPGLAHEICIVTRRCEVARQLLLILGMLAIGAGAVQAQPSQAIGEAEACRAAANETLPSLQTRKNNLEQD